MASSFRTIRPPCRLSANKHIWHKAVIRIPDPDFLVTPDPDIQIQTQVFDAQTFKKTAEKNISRFLSSKAPMTDSKTQKKPRPSRGNIDLSKNAIYSLFSGQFLLCWTQYYGIRKRDILILIRILGTVHWITDLDQLFLAGAFKMPPKNYFCFLRFFPFSYCRYINISL